MLRTHFNLRLLVLAAFVVATVTSCNKEKDVEPEPEPAAVFDKQAMLVNMADNVILPDYTAFKNALDSLASAYVTYTASGTQGDFQALKANYRTACKRYQHVSPFEFGPGESAVVRMNFNVFPTDTAQIKSNISSGTYDLATASNLDAKGFPALDYLLFKGSENELMLSFANNANRRRYVADVIAEMQARLNSVIAGWQSAYRNTFVNSLGTDVGSSIGFMVNQLNFELDYLKNAKIGIPLGKKTLGTPVPGNTEALYSAYSVEFALETLSAIEDLYLGRTTNGANGKGFDDYLTHLNSQHVNGPLNTAILSQFGNARAALTAIPDPLSAQVTGANAGLVDAAHTELLKLLVLLKTDMPSALGVVITYQDGDGD